jgi:predicted enzyme related to lactoylglutathione lyase
MARVAGLGGAFRRSKDPEALYTWYETHLGLQRREGCYAFDTAQQRTQTVAAFFPAESGYFPVAQPAMLNFQVDDLDGLLDARLAAGVEVEAKRERSDFGDYGWFTDPDGNRGELRQPK